MTGSPVTPARLVEQREARAAHALEGLGRGARLVHATAQDGRTGAAAARAWAT